MTEKETDEKMVAIIYVYESPDITRGFYCEIPEKLRRFLIFEVSAFFKQWNYNEIELWGPNDEAYMFNLKQIITMLIPILTFFHFIFLMTSGICQENFRWQQKSKQHFNHHQ